MQETTPARIDGLGSDYVCIALPIAHRWRLVENETQLAIPMMDPLF